MSAALCCAFRWFCGDAEVVIGAGVAPEGPVARVRCGDAEARAWL